MRNHALIVVLGISGIVVACGDAGSGTLMGGHSPSSSGAPSTDTVAGPAGNDSAGTDGADGGSVAIPTDPGSDAGTTTPPAPAPAGAGISCDVASILAAKCVGCHADPPVNGSLSGLVTIADLMATAKEDSTKNEAQLSLARMKSTSAPMPPASFGKPATAADIQAFQAWIDGGYQGSCADAGAPPSTNVFTGAPAFVATTSGSTHNAGKNCMGGCHDHGFTFAGTLTDGKGNAVAGAEVRLVDAKGVAITVHTGPTGNFHSATPFTAPAQVGARDATTTALMVTPLQATNGGCNGCHATGGATTPIHLP